MLNQSGLNCQSAFDVGSEPRLAANITMRVRVTAALKTDGDGDGDSDEKHLLAWFGGDHALVVTSQFHVGIKEPS